METTLPSPGRWEGGKWNFLILIIHQPRRKEMKTKSKTKKRKKKLIVEKIKNQFIIITMTFRKNIYRRILMTSTKCDSSSHSLTRPFNI